MTDSPNIVKSIFKDIPYSLLFGLLAAIFIMSFWYFNIYIFSRNFFNNAPIQIPIIFSFCLSSVTLIIYLSMSLFFSLVPKFKAFRQADPTNEEQGRKFAANHFITAGIFFAFIMSTISIICFAWQTPLAILTFIFFIISIIIDIILFIIGKRGIK